MAAELIFILNKPTLQQMSATNVVIDVWRQVFKLKNNMQKIYNFKREMEAVVRNRIEGLLIPKRLKKNLLELINPIGSQIFQWHDYHFMKNLIKKNSIEMIQWTCAGTVAKKRTAQVLLMDLGVDVKTRYRIACHYCFLEEIRTLWKQMSKGEKMHLSTEVRMESYKYFTGNLNLTVFWTFYINDKWAELKKKIWGEIESDLSPYYYAFRCSLSRGNPTATKYFFKTLSSTEKEMVLSNPLQMFAKYGPEYDSEVGYYNLSAEERRFLLSQMSEQQQLAVLKTRPMVPLDCLLVWQYHQLFFIETANRMWEYISEEDFSYLLYRILNKINHCREDCPFGTIFRQFWLLSPGPYKENIINNSNDSLMKWQIYTIRWGY